MQHCIIDPHKTRLHSSLMLPTEEGHHVFELFDAELAHEWEMYPQPHLNKLVTDLILLNLKVNITVFEIKNRSPNTI